MSVTGRRPAARADGPCAGPAARANDGGRGNLFRSVRGVNPFR
ncbi:hypothetical protein RC1_1976 [Rhodospirillum centenum SW]|uniref:Uncharacterized protein n=1 Tax=Rhodospirillum centenum (strain ATCC 51521 / SW) TaxID=414684 RepID=B6ITR9_RHOCS|nr:hypothetical protein RC1_1976 [Rhodospirillum centenum SW]